MDGAQKLAILKRWSKAIDEADEHFDALTEVMGLHPEGPTLNTVYRLADALTQATQDLLDDNSHWLSWYWLDNHMGVDAKKASPAKGVDMRPIKTLQDLLWLLECGVKKSKTVPSF